MNINEIKALAEMMSEHGLTLVEVESDEINIKLEKNVAPISVPMPIATPVAPTPVVTTSEPTPTASTESAVAQGTVITSPTVGVYYSSPSPDSAPYVSLGSTVKKGDVLCIVEAMKLMNEITSECDGEIVEIFLNNADVVEFSQPLFRIV